MDLCEKYEIDPESITNFDPKSSLEDFGIALKTEMYRMSFQMDLKAILNSNQASTLACLFPPKASYFAYRPLDLVQRVLHRDNRAARTAFL